MTTLDFVGTAPSIRPGIAMVQLNDAMWRVTRDSGEVLGYIESFPELGETRFRAKRLLSALRLGAQRSSMPLGEFWELDDAIDCFRFN